MKLDPFFRDTQESFQNGSHNIEINIRLKSLKLLEENMRVSLYSLTLGNILLDMIPNPPTQ